MLLSDSENPQRPYADRLVEQRSGEMMRWSEPYGDVGRLAETHGPPIDAVRSVGHQVTALSEIPCRVSSDLHEWRNDFPTVSTTDPAKLNYE